MSQDVVAAQPHLPVVQGSSQTTVAFFYAISFLSGLLYDFLDVASSVTPLRTGFARADRSKTFFDVSFVALQCMLSLAG